MSKALLRRILFAGAVVLIAGVVTGIGLIPEQLRWEVELWIPAIAGGTIGFLIHDGEDYPNWLAMIIAERLIIVYCFILAWITFRVALFLSSPFAV